MTINGDDIVDRIQNILQRHDTVPQELKDELILLGLAQLLIKVKDHNARLVFLEKYKPYLQAMAWSVVIIGAALLTMAVTGKLQITVIP